MAWATAWGGIQVANSNPQESNDETPQPHWHPTDENIVVLQGTFALATGDTYDPAALHDMSAGSYGFMPKRVPHFGLSKGEMRLLVYGTGLFIINFIGSAGAAQKKPAAK